MEDGFEDLPRARRRAFLDNVRRKARLLSERKHREQFNWGNWEDRYIRVSTAEEIYKGLIRGEGHWMYGGCSIQGCWLCQPHGDSRQVMRENERFTMERKEWLRGDLDDLGEESEPMLTETIPDNEKVVDIEDVRRTYIGRSLRHGGSVQETAPIASVDSVFPVLHAGWEMDQWGATVTFADGKRGTLLTNHGSAYLATARELLAKLAFYEAAIAGVREGVEISGGPR